MSKRYSGKNDSTIFNFVLLLILLLILTPAVPLIILFAIVFYAVRMKEKYILWISAVAIIIVSVIIPEALQTFFSEFTQILLNSVNRVMSAKMVSVSNSFMGYTATSWIYILLLSLIIGAYFSSRMKSNNKMRKAGIKPLSETIEDTEQKDFTVSIPKPEKDKMTLLGYNREKKPVFCDDYAKHIFICGTTGSGKTVALSNFIKTGIDKNYGLLIVDGKGAIDENSVLEITKKLVRNSEKELYIFDMNNPKNSRKYNPFAGANETICKDMLVNMSDWSEAHYKANAERYIQRLVKLLNLQGGNLSFDRIIKNMPTDKFQELSALLTKENKITKDQHLENMDIVKASGKIAESASARFSTIAESEIGEMFSDTGIDIYTALKRNAIVLFVLNPMIYPETSSVMGRLILIDAKKAISKMFGESEKRTFFLFDEINVYASTVLIDLINKSRSAGVTCIPAAQSLADLEAAAGIAFKHQIIENCNNYILLRQNSFAYAEEWAKTLGTKEIMKMTYQVSDSEATGKGTAKRVREFIIHPDDIKALQQGSGIFLSRDTGKCERINIIKPF